MDKYQNFFDSIHQYIAKRNQQIDNGVNDYNMVNVVRKENAEVGMHSNVIYSLIDPNGLHYKGDLFLKLFIKNVLKDIQSDFGEIISVKAEELTFENRRIDFTIKSTNYFVGIEMKIDAKDLDQQLSHYEADLIEKAKQDGGKTVIIYYLTKDGKEASLHSSNEIIYRKISFKEDILNWIENCQNEVKNITNLNQAFENYKDIIKKITGKYKGKLMTLEDYLQTKNIAEISKILNEIDVIQEKVSENFITTLDKYLVDIIDKEPGNSLIDIPMGQYIVRLYFNLPNSTLLLQIGDKVNCFVPVSNEKRNLFREKYLSKIKLEGINLGNLNWSIGYGEIIIGKVRYQTLETILKKANELIEKLSTILRNI